MIGFSESGCNRNVMLGLEQAGRVGVSTIGLAGGTGGDMAQWRDELLVTPSRITARIQEMHIEKRLDLVQ